MRRLFRPFFAEFEAASVKLRSREGMAVAHAKGKPRGKKPKLSNRRQKELRRMHDTGDCSISDLAELFSISRPTVYRTFGRQAGGGVAKVSASSERAKEGASFPVFTAL